MRTNPAGKPKDAHVHVYPTTNLVYTPLHCDVVCLHDPAAGARPTTPFSPSPGTLPASGGWSIWASPLSIPAHGVLGHLDPAPDRVGPSQLPLNFVDGNGYIVLRGLVEARDCEVGWNKVMEAWGSGDEKVAAKNCELLFNAGRSEDQARDLELPRRPQSKSSLG